MLAQFADSELWNDNMLLIGYQESAWIFGF